MNYTRAWEQLKNASKITIFTHQNPDGDTLASALALYNRLKKMGKRCHLYNPTPELIPQTFRFLQGIQKFSAQFPEEYKNKSAEVWVFVDCADLMRIGERGKSMQKIAHDKLPFIINIDHHMSNTHFGACNIVDSSKIATGVIMADFLRFDGALNKEEASALYVAILTDSNFFQNSRIDASLFRLCAELVECGIHLDALNDSLSRNEPLAKLRLLERFLSRLTLHHDARIATSYLEVKDYAELGGGAWLLEGFSDYLISLSSVYFGVFVYEITSGFFKVSLRAKTPHECNGIALMRGGDGHLHAASYASSFSSTNDTLIDALTMCKNQLQKTN